jgi:hypothetical protein
VVLKSGESGERCATDGTGLSGLFFFTLFGLICKLQKKKKNYLNCTSIKN